MEVRRAELEANPLISQEMRQAKRGQINKLLVPSRRELRMRLTLMKMHQRLREKLMVRDKRVTNPSPSYFVKVNLVFLNLETLAKFYNIYCSLNSRVETVPLCLGCYAQYIHNLLKVTCCIFLRS